MGAQAGFFDAEDRLRELSEADDPLERLTAVIDFDIFRGGRIGAGAADRRVESDDQRRRDAGMAEGEGAAEGHRRALDDHARAGEAEARASHLPDDERVNDQQDCADLRVHGLFFIRGSTPQPARY